MLFDSLQNVVDFVHNLADVLIATMAKSSEYFEGFKVLLGKLKEEPISTLKLSQAAIKRSRDGNHLARWARVVEEEWVRQKIGSIPSIKIDSSPKRFALIKEHVRLVSPYMCDMVLFLHFCGELYERAEELSGKHARAQEAWRVRQAKEKEDARQQAAAEQEAKQMAIVEAQRAREEGLKSLFPGEQEEEEEEPVFRIRKRPMRFVEDSEDEEEENNPSGETGTEPPQRKLFINEGGYADNE